MPIGFKKTRNNAKSQIPKSCLYLMYTSPISDEIRWVSSELASYAIEHDCKCQAETAAPFVRFSQKVRAKKHTLKGKTELGTIEKWLRPYEIRFADNEDKSLYLFVDNHFYSVGVLDYMVVVSHKATPKHRKNNIYGSQVIYCRMPKYIVDMPLQDTPKMKGKDAFGCYCGVGFTDAYVDEVEAVGEEYYLRLVVLR